MGNHNEVDRVANERQTTAQHNNEYIHQDQTYKEGGKRWGVEPLHEQKNEGVHT